MPLTHRPPRSRQLVSAIAVAAALGIPMLILQRYVAGTRNAAIILVVAWFVVSAVGVALFLRRRPGFRLAAGGTYLAVLVATIAVGYWTGFRDVVVDEDIVVATAQASAGEREQALASGGGADSGRTAEPNAGRTGPVELARGQFEGADGHSGSGLASVVASPTGQRLLTFSSFDVDPGADVDVYLVPGDGSDVSDRIDLGDLKGNVGDQQYEIPPAVDLNRYRTVVLWCIPFTVRIAVAQLDV
jgi:Electron transfer DM13